MKDASVPASTGSDVSSPYGDVGGFNKMSMYALVMLSLAYSFNYFDRMLISLLLPLIKADLQLTDTQLGLVTGIAFVLVYSVMGIPIARLADRGSRKLIVGIGFTFWSAMTALTGLVTNFWQLAATRFLMGAGEAAGTPPSVSMLSDMFNKHKRPLAMSILVSGTSFSALVLTPAAGWIGHLYGWRMAYFAAGGAGVLLGLLFLLTVKEPKRGRFDTGGEQEGLRKPPFGASASFLLGRRTFLYTTLAASLLIVSFFAYIIWGTTFMLRVHQMDIAQSATLLGPIRGLSGLAGALSAGFVVIRMAKRDERWHAWLPGVCFIVVGLSQYLFLFSPHMWVIAVGAAINSFAMTMAVPLLSLLLIQVMPPEIRTFGMASYVLANSLLGDIMGPLAIGLLNDQFNAIWGDEAIRYSMSITALIGVLAGPVMFLAGRHLRADILAAEAWRQDNRANSHP